jgi:hypothetical protein
MSRHVAGRLLGAVVIAMIVAGTPMAAQGRGGRGQAPAKPSGPAPRLPNGKPDFSGVLMGGGGVSPRALKPGDTIQLLPEAKQLQDSRLAFTSGAGRSRSALPADRRTAHESVSLADGAVG